MSKKKDKKEIIYCIYCGTKNDKSSKECCNCHKNLHKKDFTVVETIGKDIKDDTNQNILGFIIDRIKEGVTEHLYGIILTLSVAFTVTSGIVNYVNNKDNADITNTKYAFTEMTDAEKIAGCWRIVTEDDIVTYEKVNEDLSFASKTAKTMSDTSNYLKSSDRIKPMNNRLQPISFFDYGVYSISKYSFYENDSKKAEEYLNGTEVPTELENAKLLYSETDNYDENDEPVSGVFGPVGFVLWNSSNHFQVYSHMTYHNEQYILYKDYTRISCEDYDKI